MKTCTKCRETKPFDEFRKDKSKRDGHYPQCRACKVASYITESTASEVTRKRYQQIKRNARREYLNSIKSKSGCYVCGENDCPAALDFHHKVGVDKDVTISENRTMPLSKLKDEISKCVVLCANCHRKVHANFFCLV